MGFPLIWLIALLMLRKLLEGWKGFDRQGYCGSSMKMWLPQDFWREF